MKYPFTTKKHGRKCFVSFLKSLYFTFNDYCNKPAYNLTKELIVFYHSWLLCVCLSPRCPEDLKH